jgi:single-strand selective monofunctional uracil DNA glycosylase
VTDLIDVDRELAAAVDRLRFAPPVTHVYNPLIYAWEPHRRYLEAWGQGRKEIAFLGMNPGPWGMTQTGVPFGEVALARDWLRVEGPVERPVDEHPKRPVEGFACSRSEVSGRRLWGWFKERFGTPERFFARCFVLNYCPLTFLEESGRNRTPDKLPAAEREALRAICDDALRRSLEVLRPRLLIGVGRYAEQQAERVTAELDVATGRVLHPSPASPAANRGWAAQAERDLAALGIEDFGTTPGR